MFTTLLTNLQSLISSRFLISSFFPCLAFCFANATLAWFLNVPFHDYVLNDVIQTTATFGTLLTAAALIGVALFAYAEFALLPTIQGLLEGNWPAWIVSIFASAQFTRFDAIDRRREMNDRLLAFFGNVASGQTKFENLRDALLAARRHGSATLAVNNYRFRDPSARDVRRLARARRAARPIPGSDIDAAVTGLVIDLRANNADMAGPNGDAALDKTHTLLVDLIGYAEQYATAEYRSLLAARQFGFGSLPLAPTRMGNVARSVQAYAVNRYDFNFELMWSRLQFLVQRDKDFGPTLRDAKTQLDFLVSCSVLSFAASLPWAIWLRLTEGPAIAFLIVAVVGPLGGYVWYRVAVAQYRTLADLMRGAIDLFRFDLLTALHHPLPDGVSAEREVWNKIDALHALNQIWDMKLIPPK